CLRPRSRRRAESTARTPGAHDRRRRHRCDHPLRHRRVPVLRAAPRPPELTRATSDVGGGCFEDTVRMLCCMSRPVILVVDDDEESRELLAVALRDEAFEVVEAADGGTAIDTLSAQAVDL